MEFNTVTIILAVVGFSFSLFFGFKAPEIFNVFPFKDTMAWRFYQFWFNFLGSLVGWTTLWFLTRKVYSCLQISCPAQIDFMDLVTIFIAFVGITGHLPYTVMGLITGISELAKKIASAGGK